MPALGSVGRSGRGWNSILPVSPGQRMVSHSMSSIWRASNGKWSFRDASRSVVRWVIGLPPFRIDLHRDDKGRDVGYHFAGGTRKFYGLDPRFFSERLATPAGGDPRQPPA